MIKCLLEFRIYPHNHWFDFDNGFDLSKFCFNTSKMYHLRNICWTEFYFVMKKGSRFYCEFFVSLIWLVLLVIALKYCLYNLICDFDMNLICFGKWNLVWFHNNTYVSLWNLIFLVNLQLYEALIIIQGSKCPYFSWTLLLLSLLVFIWI